jgi:hypothetical protein
MRTCVREEIAGVKLDHATRIERARGRAGIGRQDRFRSGCSKERVGSTPSARTKGMHRAEDVAAVLELGERGLTASAIATELGIPRGTVRDWLAGRTPRRSAPGIARLSCGTCGAGVHQFSELPPVYVYLLGLYLGDGCISRHRRDVYRLRIVLDLRYPGIVDECAAAIGQVMPHNAVHRQMRRGGFTPRDEYTNVEVSAYSKAWPCLFPQHGSGRKHKRRIELSAWQRELVALHPELLLRGLIHSDGCRFQNTGRGWSHPRYSFANLSDDIKRIFCDTCDLMGLRWTSAGEKTIYVSRKADVAVLDVFVGPKA